MSADNIRQNDEETRKALRMFMDSQTSPDNLSSCGSNSLVRSKSRHEIDKNEQELINRKVLVAYEMERVSDFLKQYDKQEDINCWKTAALTILHEKIYSENKYKIQNEKLNYENIDMRSNLNRFMAEAKVLTSIVIFRKKVERLEAKFRITAEFSSSDMQQQITKYVREVKNETTISIADKLTAMEDEQRVKLRNHFNIDSIQSLADDIFSKWKSNISEKIEECNDLSPNHKVMVQEIMETTVKQLDSIKITDQYPVRLNARFVRWMFHLLFSLDPRAKYIKECIENDPSLDLVSFCCSVSNLHSVCSTVYPPTTTIQEMNLSYKEVKNTLQKYKIAKDDITIKMVEIILKTGLSESKIAAIEKEEL